MMFWNTLLAVFTLHALAITLFYILVAIETIDKHDSITKHIIPLHKTVIINIKFTIRILTPSPKGVLLERNKNMANILTHYAINFKHDTNMKPVCRSTGYIVVKVQVRPNLLKYIKAIVIQERYCKIMNINLLLCNSWNMLPTIGK